jgi:hypothetical protein
LKHPVEIYMLGKTKEKVKLFPQLINSVLCHEDIGVSGGTAPPFSISALGGVEWSASRPSHFKPCEISLGAHYIGGWVGHRAGLDDEMRKMLTLPGFEPGSPSPQSIAIPTEISQALFM